LLTLQTSQRCKANIMAIIMRTSDREGSRWAEADVTLASLAHVRRAQSFSSELMKGAITLASRTDCSGSSDESGDFSRIAVHRLAEKTHSSTGRCSKPRWLCPKGGLSPNCRRIPRRRLQAPAHLKEPDSRTDRPTKT
jgi:hypothetical protein